MYYDAVGSIPIVEFTKSEVLGESSTFKKVQKVVLQGGIGICREFYPPPLAVAIRDYLTRIGQNSLPTYEPIEIGRPNFHRLNQVDERSYVKGCFHQFVFYPWNQDVFNLFALSRELFQLKNLLSNNDPNKYLGLSGESEMVSRLAFQFYPSGQGFLNLHADPVGEHQLVVPTASFSKKGVDFTTGGAYIQDLEGVKHDVDSMLNLGDVVLFDAKLRHGVELIDTGSHEPWLNFSGRWTLLIATNKIASNRTIANAMDLGN